MAQLAQSTTLHFSRSEIVSVLSGLMLAMFLASLDQTIVATSLSTMAQDLNGWSLMSWVVSAYLVASTVTTPIYGRLSDLYGRRPILLISIALFVAASVLCALSQTMLQLIAARVLQGVGGGGLRSVSQAAIADVIPPRERGKYQGYFSSVMAVSNLLGPVLGGFFADYLTWHWIFWINIPFGALALVSVQPQSAAAAEAAAQAGHRLARRGADHRLDHADPDRGRPGRSGRRLGPDRRARADRDRHRVSRRLDRARARGARTDDPAAPLRQSHLRHRQPDRLYHVDGDDRADHPGAALFRAGCRAGGEPGRHPADPDDRRHRFGLVHRRATGHPYRALPRLSGPWRSPR